MAISFDWYENPNPSDKEQEEKTLHPRILLNGSTTTKELRRRIQIRSSLTETDVTAVLDALSHVLGEDLADGRQVHLDGIGYFHPVLTCTEPVTHETKRKSTKVKLKAIKFRADQELKNQVGSIKVHPLKLNKFRERLTDAEIDMRLKNYFSTHAFMTRVDFQTIAGMARSTAMAYIRELRKDGKLKNEGTMMHPIYVPGEKLEVDNKKDK